jgi:hypothetical protein
MEDPAVSKSTSTRLGQILLDKGLVTTEQLDIAIKEQQKRRQLLDPFDANLGVNSSLGEILIELGFIDRLQLKRGLNWQLMLRKMAIVMSFCAPLMTVSYGAAAATFGATPRPTFTATSSSSVAPKANPTFTKTSSSASSAPAVLVVDNDAGSSSSDDSTPEPIPVSSAASTSSRTSSIKSSSSSSKASSVASSVRSSVASESFAGLDTTAPKMPEKITVDAALYDRVQLSWNDATDEAGVTRYKIYRDQVQIDTLDAYQTEYVDFNIAPGKTYLYGISAGDDAGNWSVIKSVFAQTAATQSNTSGQVSSTAISASGNSSSKAVSSSTSSKASVASSTGSSKAPSSVTSNSSSKAASSVVSNASSSKASSSAASSSGIAVAGPVNFNWTPPILRENGNPLDITEVGGYELRYRKVTDINFIYVTVNDAWKNYYNFTWLEGTFVFQIAAFDKNGNYSSFVDIAPH